MKILVWLPEGPNPFAMDFGSVPKPGDTIKADWVDDEGYRQYTKGKVRDVVYLRQNDQQRIQVFTERY